MFVSWLESMSGMRSRKHEDSGTKSNPPAAGRESTCNANACIARMIVFSPSSTSLPLSPCLSRINESNGGFVLSTIDLDVSIPGRLVWRPFADEAIYRQIAQQAVAAVFNAVMNESPGQHYVAGTDCVFFKFISVANHQSATSLDDVPKLLAVTMLMRRRLLTGV